MSTGTWCRVPIDETRALIYGPNLGRLYIVTAAQSQDRHLQRILGLRPYALDEAIADPAESIVHDRGSLKTTALPVAPVSLRIAYRLLHCSRRIVPLRAIVSLVCKAAAIARRGRASSAAPQFSIPSQIGRLLYSIERDVGIADCYPRALMTAFLALQRGQRCAVSIGALAPTRKMHAWCSIDGKLPYEALP